MTLKEIPRTVSGISIDSRTTKKGDAFVAIKGSEFDGHNFINDAIKKGATCIVTNSDVETAMPLVRVRDTRKALASLAADFYGNPSRELKVIGITGTNGKTTVSFLLQNILKQAGMRTGLIGTINYKIGNKAIDAINTTPSALILQKLLKEMVDDSTDFAVMEVSSHSLAQHRTDNINFDTAVFTNITPEHLDYHKSFKQYLEAKKRLFSALAPASWAVLNSEDPLCEDIANTVRSKKIMNFGIESDADVWARDIKMNVYGSQFVMGTKKESFNVKTSLIGRHNISNILAASAAALAEGIDLKTIEKAIRNFNGVPGRLQAIGTKKRFSVFIDYAHTDDALKNALKALTVIKKRNLIVVFGCGGMRDRTKRPRMGHVAANFADYIIITSDNPRSEDPRLIAKEVESGINKGFTDYEIILDRKKAIEKALALAKSGDFILIAGKGHETYQIIGDKRIPFNDEEIVREFIR